MSTVTADPPYDGEQHTTCAGCACGANNQQDPLLPILPSKPAAASAVDKDAQNLESGYLKEEEEEDAPEVLDLKVLMKVGELDPYAIVAMSLPRLIFEQKLNFPAKAKEHSSISLTIAHSPIAAYLINKYSTSGIPDGKVVMTIQVGDEVCTWIFHDALVEAIDYGTFSFSQQYQSTNDFKCDIAFSNLEILMGEQNG